LPAAGSLTFSAAQHLLAFPLPAPRRAHGMRALNFSALLYLGQKNAFRIDSA
jgi:hypothetical protein